MSWKYITFSSRDGQQLTTYIHYGFTRFNGNYSMVDMTLNDTECTILSLNHLPGQRMAYKKKVDQAGIHQILPFLPGPRKLIILFSHFALLAKPSRYHQVNGGKFPPPSAECCRLIHHYSSLSAPHVYLCSV